MNVLTSRVIDGAGDDLVNGHVGRLLWESGQLLVFEAVGESQCIRDIQEVSGMNGYRF